MKTKTETITVPPEEGYSYEVVTYLCEHCPEEEFGEVESYKEHYGLKHAAKDSKRVGGLEFLRFESQDDYFAYHDNRSEHLRGRFEGPGWYAMIAEEESCTRGCGSHWFISGVPASEMRRRWEEKRDKVVADLEALAQLK